MIYAASAFATVTGLAVLIGGVAMGALCVALTGPYGPSASERRAGATLAGAIAFGGLVLFIIGVRTWP